MPDDETAHLRELLAEALSWLVGDFQRYNPTAHPDHNRWSWRGDGHPEAMRAEYRERAAAVVGIVLRMSPPDGTLEQ